MWQCLSTIMMKKIGNLQISFISSALVNKDVYYNRAKKKSWFWRAAKHGEILWQAGSYSLESACFLSVALGFLCIEPELQPFFPFPSLAHHLTLDHSPLFFLFSLLPSS